MPQTDNNSGALCSHNMEGRSRTEEVGAAESSRPLLTFPTGHGSETGSRAAASWPCDRHLLTSSFNVSMRPRDRHFLCLDTGSDNTKWLGSPTLPTTMPPPPRG